MDLDLANLLAPTATIVPWTVALAAAAIGCATDVHKRKLPNWLTLPLWFSGLVFAFATAGLAGFGLAFASSVLLAIPFVILFVCAAGGAGDAKMMAGLGAWLGLVDGGITLAAVAIAGGVIAILISLIHREGKALSQNMGQTVLGFVGMAQGRLSVSDCAAMIPRASSMRRMPYGIAIMAGTAIAFIGVQPW